MSLLFPGCCCCAHDEHDTDVSLAWGLQDEHSPDTVHDEVLFSSHYPEPSFRPSVRHPLPLARAREEFDALKGSDGKVGVKELAQIWQACAMSQQQEIGREERTVIAIAAEHYMRHMNLARDFRVGHCVLVAFMLGVLTAPVHPGVLRLQDVIRKIANLDPEETLNRIVSEFLVMDKGSTGLVKLTDFMAFHGESACNMLAFEAADLSCEKGISLWDYIVHSLRRWTVSVELVIYDLSKGVASMLGSTPVCRGPQKFEALYHTSILVHGAEYWYGLSIRRNDDPPVDGAFGPPLDKFAEALQPSEYVPDLRVVRLGRTFARKEEVFSLVSSMAGGKFAKGKYNAFSNNCNSFTHEVSLLLTGRGIPRAVRMQSELFMSSPTVRMVLPAIKILLGEQGSQMDIPELPKKPITAEASAKPEEEILGMRGQLCGFWSKDAGMSRYGVVVAAWESGFDIRWFDPRTCMFCLQVAVPAGSVHSWFSADLESEETFGLGGSGPQRPSGDTDETEMEVFEV